MLLQPHHTAQELLILLLLDIPQYYYHILPPTMVIPASLFQAIIIVDTAAKCSGKRETHQKNSPSEI